MELFLAAVSAAELLNLCRDFKNIDVVLITSLFLIADDQHPLRSRREYNFRQKDSTINRMLWMLPSLGKVLC